MELADSYLKYVLYKCHKNMKTKHLQRENGEKKIKTLGEIQVCVKNEKKYRSNT